MFQKIRQYFLEELWNFPLAKETGRRHFFFKSLRIAVLSVRDFFQDNCLLHASSLTYYTIIATVPILALFFALAKGFGFQDFLRERIVLRFQENQELTHQIFTFVERMIEQAKGGVIAGMGIVLLFWSITHLLSNLENAMNQIWKVKKLRSWRRIFTDYFALMLIGPCLFFLSISASILFVKKAEEGIDALHLGSFLSNSLHFIAEFVPYCLFWFLFTFIYLFMPNKRVSIPSAFLGGIVGGTIYLIIQFGYIYFQFAFNRFGAIYGSFAAVPLFLIWVQVSWFVLLLGAEIAHAHETLDLHEYEEQSKKASLELRRLISLWIVHLSISKFMNGEPSLTRKAIRVRYQIPYALASPILDDLISSGILLDTPQGLLPTKPTEELRIADVISAIERKGTSDFPFLDAQSLAPFERALESFQREIEASSENKPIYLSTK